MWSDDPVADYDRYDAEQARKLKQLPICAECGEHIQNTYCYEIEGEYICKSCLIDNHRCRTERLMRY